MNFMELTFTGEDERKTFINLDHVNEILTTEGGTLVIYGECSSTVKETPEQIMAFIREGKF